MHTAFFGLPKNSQVIRVWGAAAPRVFLTRITCFVDLYGERGPLFKGLDLASTRRNHSNNLSKLNLSILLLCGSNSLVTFIIVLPENIFEVV